MPKAILEFNLPEETLEFQRAARGDQMVAVFCELDHWLRSQIKYADLPEEQAGVFERVREELYHLLAEQGIDLDWV